MTDAYFASHSHEFSRFLNARKCYGPSFSPDGTRVSFISDLSGIPQTWLVSARGGWPEQLTFTDDRVGLAVFAPNAERLIAGTDVGGDENVQLWLLAGDGSRLRPLTHRLDAMHPFGHWSPDGRHIAYASNEREKAHLDVVIQEVETGLARTVLQTDGMFEVADWSPDGRRLLVCRIDSSMNNEIFEVDLESGGSRLLSQHAGSVRFEQPSYRSDRHAIYVLTDLGRDFLALCELDLATGHWTPIVEDRWDVETYAVSPDGHSIAVVANVDGYSTLTIFDRRNQSQKTVEVPKGVIARSFVGNWHDGVRWSPDGRRLAFSLTTARTTQNVWLADPADGACWPLTHATIGGIPDDHFVEPELIHYPTFDGRMIPAFLFKPRSTSSGAAVVLVHGGPESQSRPAFDPTVQYLVDQGYTVLIPNVRGSTGYGTAYSHLDDIEQRLDAVADVKAGAEWLSQAGHAHAQRIAVMGGSYGGFMVLASLVTYPDTWAAGIDLYGLANFVSFLENTHPFRRKHREAEYGSLERDRDVLVRISPITHLDRLVAPLFVAHGENDIRVPISETDQVVARLRAQHVPVEFLRLPNEGHGFVRLENKLRVYPAIVHFLDRYLKNNAH